MSETGDRSMSPSPARRVVCDLLHAGMQHPTAAIQKAMDLHEVDEARRAAKPRPSWCSIFTKAYGKVVASRPDLRRAFLTFPSERIYEYAATTADVAVECRDGEETALVWAALARLESSPLLDIDRRLAACKNNPETRGRRYRRGLILARFPRFVRRAVWWFLLNVSGRKRARYFGTFGVTSVGNWGVESLRPVAPCITLLHYGVVDPSGHIVMRLTYDHRILDGWGPSTALVEMERVLKTEILAELNALRGDAPDSAIPKAA
jgi:hypothetical protein